MIFQKKKRPHFVEMAESRNQNVMGWGENEKWGSWDAACRICFGPFGVPKKLEYGVEGEEKGNWWEECESMNYEGFFFQVGWNLIMFTY